MTRRFPLVALFSLVVSCFVASRAEAQTQQDRLWWHNSMTQAGRNNLIARTGLSYPDGVFVAGECKEWVRRVVLQASKKVVTIPPTVNNSTWAYSPDVGIGNAFLPGTIVQMSWRGGSGVVVPHTMIILGIDLRGINVVDCNWYSKTNYSCVYRHSISWADFQSRAQAYTIYYIK